MEREAVKLRTLPLQVAAVVARRIASDELDAGLVPSELQICREFGVSRAVAREALKVLAAVDMVEISQGRRVVVRPVDEWDYLDPLLMDWLPPAEVPRLLQELHDARVIIEPGLAARAAQMAKPEDLERMRTALEGMAATTDVPDEFLEFDLQFHLEICRATRNRMLDRFMYSSRWWQSASRRITNRGPRALPDALSDHRRIYAAIEEADPDAAERMMRRHLLSTAPLLEPVTTDRD